jgi:hypothetical protein
VVPMAALHRLPQPRRRPPRRARHQRPQMAEDRRALLGRRQSVNDATVSTDAAGPGRSAGRAASAVRDLHPGYFAFVMATGIISTGTFLLGPLWLSWALLAAASAGPGRADRGAGDAAGILPLQRGRRHPCAGPGIRVLHHHSRPGRPGRAARARRASAGHRDPLGFRRGGVAGADLRRPRQPAAWPGTRLGARRRQRQLAAVDRRHPVAVARGGCPCPGVAVTVRAARADCGRTVVRRIAAVPDGRHTDPAALAHPP